MVSTIALSHAVLQIPKQSLLIHDIEPGLYSTEGYQGTFGKIRSPFEEIEGLKKEGEKAQFSSLYSSKFASSLQFSPEEHRKDGALKYS